MCKIYFWNHKKLAEDLRDNLVSEKQKFTYLVITLIIAAITMELCSNKGVIVAADTYYFGKLALNIIIGGFLIAFMGYRENNKGDGVDYITRYVCLELPVGIKALVITLVVSTVVGFVYAVLSNKLGWPLWLSVINILTLLLFYVLYYRFLVEAIRIAASGSTKKVKTKPVKS